MRNVREIPHIVRHLTYIISSPIIIQGEGLALVIILIKIESTKVIASIFSTVENEIFIVVEAAPVIGQEDRRVFGPSK